MLIPLYVVVSKVVRPVASSMWFVVSSSSWHTTWSLLACCLSLPRSGCLWSVVQNIRTLDNGRALYVYGGAAGANDELAAKGTGHDLKGAVSYLNYFQTRAALSPDAYKAMGPSVNRVPMQVWLQLAHSMSHNHTDA